MPVSTRQWNKLRNYGVDYISSLYQQGKTLKEVSECCGVSLQAIWCFLKKNNIPTRTQSEAKRRYPINEHFFDIIDNEHKAYFLGFIYADGCNSPNRYSVCINLQEDDKEMLITFKNMIQPLKPLIFINKQHLRDMGKKDHNQYKLDIHSKHISQRMIELGVPQAKTFKLRFPEWMPENLQHHFIRGYFDGDGCMCISKRKQTQSTECTFSIVGINKFLRAIQKIMMKKLMLKRTKLEQKNKYSSIYALRYGGATNCLKIKNWLYGDATIFLKRKKDKFDAIHEKK